MRSTSAKFRLPTALQDTVQKRCREAGYESLSEYVLGLVRYDLLTRKPHATTEGLARLSRAEQDKVDDEIVKLFTSGETLGGGWFEERLKEAVAAAGNGDPDRSRIVTELLRRLQP